MMAGIWIFGQLRRPNEERKPSFLLFQLGAVISIVVYSQLTDPDIMLLAGAFLGMFVNGMMGGYGALMAEAIQQKLEQRHKTYFSILVVP